MSRDEQAARNREDFPVTTKAVDILRAKFGAGVKVIWAEENGKTIGRKDGQTKW